MQRTFRLKWNCSSKIQPYRREPGTWNLTSGDLQNQLGIHTGSAGKGEAYQMALSVDLHSEYYSELHRIKFRGQICTRVPFVNVRHKVHSLSWVINYRDSIIDGYNRMIWNGASTFQLCHVDRSLRIRQ